MLDLGLNGKVAMHRARRAIAVMGLGAMLAPAVPARLPAQEVAAPIPNPAWRDMFQLNDLDSYRQFSRVLRERRQCGITVLRYTGPMLARPPLPGAR